METVLQSVSFNESADHLLQKVEYRRIVSTADRSAVYALRYESYLREGAIDENASKSLRDDFDDAENSWTYGIYIDGELAASIRLGLATPDNRDIPARKTFPEFIDPILDTGESMIDPTRFVLKEEYARIYSKLPYITLRIAWAISDYLGVDHTLASVRTEHQAFYRRFFGHKLLCPARPYPTLIKPLSLMIIGCKAIREQGLRRYPFLASTVEECRDLLGESDLNRVAREGAI